MHFEEGLIYHVYNKGNNGDKLFYQPRNYLFFISKIRIHLKPVCDILAYCLMPNHFHLLIRANSDTIRPPVSFKMCNTKFGEEMRKLLTGYTRAINKQELRSGSLFQQNTKAKCVQNWTMNFSYEEYCFFYIHRNPLKANLVKDLKLWPYSSFLDLAGYRKGTLVERKIAKQLLPTVDWENFEDYLNLESFPEHWEGKIF